MTPGLSNTACARLFAAWAGSPWAGAEDRAIAARLEDIAPGCGALVTGARRFHRRAVRWSLSHACGGGVICGAGLPAKPMPYESDSGQVLPGRWVLADPSKRVTTANGWLDECTQDGARVSAIRGTASDPDAILARPQVRAIAPPLSVHSHMSAQFWPPGLAERAVARWAELLPAGSVLAMTLWLAGDGDVRRAWDAAVREAGVRGRRYSAADVRRWFTVPRLEIEEFTVGRCAAGSVAHVVAVAG